MTKLYQNSITIDLSNSNGDSIYLEKGNLIHSYAYDRIKDIICSHLKKIKNKKNQLFKSNLSLFIDGTRGAGKSTFLKNAVKELEDLTDYHLEKLIYIDPSKIELNEHIFLTLIAQLNRKIIKKYQSNISTDNEYDATYESWRKKLKKLAGGLRLLNSAKSPYDLIDDDVFLDWGLDRADDAMQLAAVFKELIEHACKILDCDAFLILIDDADTHFKKGEQVLEMVRRYLDIPELIIIMAGDLQLYSTIVRGLYLGNMSENLHKYDSSRNKERCNLLDHMEDQYLKKLFPSQNRVLLKPLSKLIREQKYFVNHDQMLLTSAIDKIIKVGLHTKAESDIQIYREFILQQPLRSVLQLLQINEHKFYEESSSLENFTVTSSIAQNFRDAFFSSLISAKVEVDKLNYGDESALIESVFDSVVKEGGQDTGCYLRPQAIEENQRNSFVALASTVAEFTQGKASSAISYMLQCCGSVSIFYDAQGDLEKKYPANQEEQIQQFKRYCGIGQHEDGLNWAWHSTAILVSKKSTPSVKAGTIHLKSGSINNDDSKISVDDYITNDKKASLPFTLGLVEVIGHNKQLYFSIFNILGAIGRLLKISEEVILNADKFQDYDSTIGTSNVRDSLRKNVTDCLYKFESTLGVSAPNWISERNTTPLESSGDQKNLETDRTYMNDWAEKICEWLIAYRRDSKNIIPSSVFLGKVWIRLYFTLISVANDKGNRESVDNLISLYAHSLINAFLVEEQDHHINIDGKITSSSNKISKNNPRTSLKVVNSKLNIIKNNNFDGFPFTKIIATCPIIQGLILENEDNYINDSTFVSSPPSYNRKLVISRIGQKDIDNNLSYLLELEKISKRNRSYEADKRRLEAELRDLKSKEKDLRTLSSSLNSDQDREKLEMILSELNIKDIKNSRIEIKAKIEGINTDIKYIDRIIETGLAHISSIEDIMNDE
ncbi:hypothetical protein [Acinetobacter bereziniae]|jgi:hypothetical protein|uniref:hypothetical protein n=1 Tax=Acinetobacter bereziniae TaxID=106648 RepID=UPI00125ED6DD|nr:hypothetical protein [Acinetobacter bereziniae]